MKLFRQDNTDGYSDEQLSALNDEWDKIVAEKKLVDGTDEYDSESKRFSDAVSKR